MKLIIDIDEKEYKTILANAELYKDKNWGSADVWDAILNATPISTDSDLISRNTLKEQFNQLEMVTNNSSIVEQAEYKMLMTCINLIDNAPIIEAKTTHDINSAYDKGFITAMKAYSAPRGEWILVDDTEKFIAKCSVCGRTEDSRMVKYHPFCHCGARMKGSEISWNRCQHTLETEETIRVLSEERPQGEWKVYGKQGDIPITDMCSNCRYEMKWYKNKYKFCPNCGAKMGGKKNEDK